MGVKKNASTGPKDTPELPRGITWEEVIELINSKKYQQLFNTINPKTLKLATEENNKPKVIKALLKALKLTDPDNATLEYAQKLVDVMQKISQTVLSRK